MNMMMGGSKKILEINPHNPIIQELKSKSEIDKTDSTVKDLAHLMFETSLLSSGFSLDDPSLFTSRIHRMIQLGLSIDIENDDTDSEASDLPPLEGLDDEDENNMESVD